MPADDLAEVFTAAAELGGGVVPDVVGVDFGCSGEDAVCDFPSGEGSEGEGVGDCRRGVGGKENGLEGGVDPEVDGEDGGVEDGLEGVEECKWVIRVLGLRLRSLCRWWRVQVQYC